MVNPIDFGGHSSKVKVTMVIIDKCGVRGDASLCVVIFNKPLRDNTCEIDYGYMCIELNVGLNFHFISQCRF